MRLLDSNKGLFYFRDFLLNTKINSILFLSTKCFGISFNSVPTWQSKIYSHHFNIAFNCFDIAWFSKTVFCAIYYQPCNLWLLYEQTLVQLSISILRNWVNLFLIFSIFAMQLPSILNSNDLSYAQLLCSLAISYILSTAPEALLFVQFRNIIFKTSLFLILIKDPFWTFFIFYINFKKNM